MDYSDKYSKYKNKYLELKNSVQTGGAGFGEFINKPIYYRRESVEKFLQPPGSIQKIENGSHFIFIGNLYSDEGMEILIGTTKITYTIIQNYETHSKDMFIVVRLSPNGTNQEKDCLYYNGKIEKPLKFAVNHINGEIMPYSLLTILKNNHENKMPSKLEYNIINGQGTFTLIN